MKYILVLSNGMICHNEFCPCHYSDHNIINGSANNNINGIVNNINGSANNNRYPA